MKIKPNLFVIGAPKCGTTSLCHYLESHNEICFSEPKEAAENITGYVAFWKGVEVTN